MQAQMKLFYVLFFSSKTLSCNINIQINYVKFISIFLTSMFKEETLLIYSIPLYLFIIGAEIIISQSQKLKIYSSKEVFTNLYLMTLNMLLDVLLRGVTFGLLYFFYLNSISLAPSGIKYWIVLILFVDFMFYWLHRIDHTVRFFWAVHVTHHSSREFNLTTGFRSSVFQPLYRFIYFIPIALFGFHPLDIFVVYAFAQIYGILIHTQLVGDLGILEYILVTPSHHRVHHASNVIFLDKNMGMMFIFWDKIFGTYKNESDLTTEQIKYGLVGGKKFNAPIKVITHEWESLMIDIKKAPNFKTKLKYLFSPPGWSYNGSTKTSKQLQAELKNKIEKLNYLK